MPNLAIFHQVTARASPFAHHGTYRMSFGADVGSSCAIAPCSTDSAISREALRTIPDFNAKPSPDRSIGYVFTVHISQTSVQVDGPHAIRPVHAR